MNGNDLSSTLSIIALIKLMAVWIICLIVIALVTMVGPYKVIRSFFLLTQDENRRKENPFKAFIIGSVLMVLPLVIGAVRYTLSSSNNPIEQSAANTLDLSNWANGNGNGSGNGN